jgi:type IV secretory pathway protease TraF
VIAGDAVGRDYLSNFLPTLQRLSSAVGRRVCRLDKDYLLPGFHRTVFLRCVHVDFEELKDMSKLRDADVTRE